jgi:tetratricopeptide (TPR) repeat protein
VYVFITDDAFPADPHAAEDEEHGRLQAVYRQALMQTGQDYCLALSREDIDQKVRSLHLQVELLTEELTRTDDRVVATGRRLGRRSALILVLVLAILGTLSYVVWRGEQQRQQAQNVAQVTTGIAERFLDKLLTNKDISAEEARRQALAELPVLVGLPADIITQLIERKIAARVQDTSLSSLERARAALAVGNYEAVFVESAKQRVESRELAILEGTAALARFRDDPQLSWQTKALAAFQRALALSEATTRPLEWADAALWVAYVLADLARYGEAEPLLRHALQLRESQYGPTRADVSTVLNNLALLLKATNRLAEAEPLMQRALTIDEQSFGPMHPKVAIDLNNLAQLLKAINRLTEAEPLMRRAVRIFLDFTRNTGHKHPHLDACMTNYVMLLHALGRSKADIREALEALTAEPR